MFFSALKKTSVLQHQHPNQIKLQTEKLIKRRAKVRYRNISHEDALNFDQ